MKVESAEACGVLGSLLVLGRPFEVHGDPWNPFGILLEIRGVLLETRGILLGCMGNGNLRLLDMVVEKCLFYGVFLKVVFQKHVNHNEKITFRNIRKKKEKNKRINRL